MPRRKQFARHFSVRVAEDELRQLRRRAAAAGLSLARYVVASALAGSPAPLSSAERALRQRAIFHARKIGVNLNQIARQLNSGDAVSRDRLSEALDASKDALRRLTGA